MPGQHTFSVARQIFKRPPVRRSGLMTRFYTSASGSSSEKPLSPHIAIYKQFGTPFAKVLGIALTTFLSLKYARIALVEEADRIDGVPAKADEGAH